MKERIEKALDFNVEYTKDDKYLTLFLFNQYGLVTFEQYDCFSYNKPIEEIVKQFVESWFSGLYGICISSAMNISRMCYDLIIKKQKPKFLCTIKINTIIDIEY